MKNLFKLFGFIALVAVIGFTMAACGDGNPGGGDVAVTGVSLNQSSRSMFEGDTATLVPTVVPGNATNKAVTWDTNDEAKATVADGVVTAVAEGTATITVKTVDGDFIASCSVTVLVRPPDAKKATAISLSETSLSLVAGEDETLTYTLTPSDAYDVVNWASSNPAVATVDNGVVTAVAVGTATITVSALYVEEGSDVKATCTVTVSPAPEPMSGKTALQYFAENNIKAGWNLGNTLDAVSIPSAAIETAWGNPRATQALLNGVKESGFDMVRIGCTWIGHIGSAPNYKVSEARLQRVAEVVGYAKNAGFKAIVINIHHDGNYTQPPNTWGFVDFAGAVNNATKKNQVQDQIGKVWTQIAEYFKNYGDYLIFETLNEVHGGNWGFGASTAEQDILFDWNKAALDAIRATGGNNATRFVAVPGLGSTEPDIVVAAHSRSKLLPNDGANGTGKLIVSVHYYAPTNYTVAGVTDFENPLIHTWSDTTTLNHEFELLKTTFFDNGIAVYAGEWGAPTDVRSSMSTAIKNTHLDYMGSVATAARANGVVPILWDDGGNFKCLERSNGKPKTGLWKDVLDKIMSAINSTTPPDIDIGGGGITPPPNTVDLGNYRYGTEDDGTTPNKEQAVWELDETNLAIAKTPGTQLVLELNANPVATLQLVWQGPDNELWWNQADEDEGILGENGEVVDPSTTTWNAETKTLTIDLEKALFDYTAYTNQPSLNIVVAYYGGDGVDDLDIVSAKLVGVAGKVIGGDIDIGSYTWNAFNDEANSGTSSIIITQTPGTINISGNVTNAYEYGFVGWEAAPDATKLATLKTATSISFKVKGDGKTYKLMLPTSDITDFSYYFKTFTATAAQTTITINIGELASPGWGQSESVTFDQSKVGKIQWQTNDSASGPFSLSISDLTLN